MENSPIVLAHNHARSAVLETRRSNPVAASEEHDLAATEFATAANSTSDSEAHRILLLLEEHHKKLGQIIRSRHENASQHAQNAPPSTPALPPIQSRSAEAAATALSQPLRTASPERSHAIPKLSQNVRSIQRESSNSIASNLASARGIPGSQQKRGSPASPTLSAQHAGGRMATRSQRQEEQSRETGNTVQQMNNTGPDSRDLSRLSKAVDSESQNSNDPSSQEGQASDAPFQQFYNTFESLISKISAPLAFAGLPLTSPAPAPSDPKSPKPTKQPSTSSQKRASAPPRTTNPKPNPNSSNEVDYSNLISRAALRAVRDGGPFNPSVAESFYVVPTTGGTVSYAGILNHDQTQSQQRHHTRQLSDISATNEDFVDARETLIPSRTNSPELTRLDSPSKTTNANIPAPLIRRSHQQNSSSRTSSHPQQQQKTPHRIPEQATFGGKTLEELQLENTALKHLSDTLSKRLHMWETTSQSQGAALHQSLRSLSQRPSSPASVASGGSAGVAVGAAAAAAAAANQATTAIGDENKIRELEAQLKKMESQTARQERENEKLRNVVGRYRERWERLKEGAKSRREGNLSSGGGGGNPKGEGEGEAEEKGA